MTFKTLSTATATFTFLLLNSVFTIAPVRAFSLTLNNAGFESTVNFNDGINWEGTGDSYIDNSTGFTQVNPVEGSSHAVVTTGRHIDRDDPDTAASTFNYSGNEPVTATSNNGADALQDFLGLSTGALTISRSGSADDTKSRTAKEGSGILQQFTITIDQTDINDGKNIFELSFNWGHLTNDPADSLLGNQDFSFFTIYDTSFPIGDRAINLLGDSSSTGFSTPLGSGTTTFQDVNTTYYDDSNNTYTYTSAPITTEGTYTYNLGFGVVDVDGPDRTSALLVDNLNVRQIPFEFSPAGGILLVATIFGLGKCKKAISQNKFLSFKK